MRIFLTGGSGFLGGRIAKSMVERGHSVVASVRPGSHRSHLNLLGVTVVEGQLDDDAHLLQSMQECDALAHIAGAAGRFYADAGH